MDKTAVLVRCVLIHHQWRDRPDKVLEFIAFIYKEYTMVYGSFEFNLNCISTRLLKKNIIDCLFSHSVAAIIEAIYMYKTADVTEENY